MILAFPFDNTEYGADALGAWLATRTRGVFCEEDNLRVVANNNLTVTVKKGIAWLKMRDDWGIVFNNTEDIVLNIEVDDKAVEKSAAVVCQLDKLNSKASILIRASENGERPVPIRDDQYDEIILAHIWLRKNFTSITAGDISDLRLDEEYCGLMRDGVTQIPTQSLQEQANALLDTLREAIAQMGGQEGVMLASVYDPNNTGMVLSAESAEYVPWSGVIGKPTEKFVSYTGQVGKSDDGSFYLAGQIIAHKIFNYWAFDFTGTRYYRSGSKGNGESYGFSRELLEGITGSRLKIADGKIVGNLQIYYGVSAISGADDENTGKLAKELCDTYSGGILMAVGTDYIAPAKIVNEDDDVSVIPEDDALMTTTRNDRWIARFYIEAK